MQPPHDPRGARTAGPAAAAVQAPAIELLQPQGLAGRLERPRAAGSAVSVRAEDQEMYFWVPQSGSMGIGVSMLSYAGKVYVGMIADRLHRRASRSRGSPGTRVRAAAARGDGAVARRWRATRNGEGSRGRQRAGRRPAARANVRRPPRCARSRRALIAPRGNTEAADRHTQQAPRIPEIEQGGVPRARPAGVFRHGHVQICTRKIRRAKARAAHPARRAGGAARRRGRWTEAARTVALDGELGATLSAARRKRCSPAWAARVSRHRKRWTISRRSSRAACSARCTSSACPRQKKSVC